MMCDFILAGHKVNEHTDEDMYSTSHSRLCYLAYCWWWHPCQRAQLLSPKMVMASPLRQMHDVTM